MHARKIAINALKDEAEADKFLDWLREEINDTWRRRSEIEPRFDIGPQPVAIEIFKLLPKTNCGECNQGTCTAFALQVADGGRDFRDCSQLCKENEQGVEAYLNSFKSPKNIY